VFDKKEETKLARLEGRKKRLQKKSPWGGECRVGHWQRKKGENDTSEHTKRGKKKLFERKRRKHRAKKKPICLLGEGRARIHILPSHGI